MSQSKKGVFSVFKQEGNSRQAPFYCRWTEEEDKLLFEAVDLHGPHKWSLIARSIPGRTSVQCSTRWLGALNPHVHKGRWSEEEDEALTASVKPYLTDASVTEENLPWSSIAQYIPNRTGIQCQARWTEALDPSVRKGRWRKEEDDMLKVGVERFGCCWIRVAGSIPGRTQRQCRTRYNQIRSKRQKTQGGSSATTKSTVKKRQRKRKRSDGNVVQWKTSAQQQQAINVLSATLIQLAVPDQIPYNLLSKQPANAIVIPSEIASPISSPAYSASSSMEEDGYFCTSPASTWSSDTCNEKSPLTATDAAKILDDFGSSFASFINGKPNNNDNNYMLFSTLFSNDFMNQFDLSSPLSLINDPSNFQQEGTVSMENLVLNSDPLFTSSSNAVVALLSS